MAKEERTRSHEFEEMGDVMSVTLFPITLTSAINLIYISPATIGWFLAAEVRIRSGRRMSIAHHKA